MKASCTVAGHRVESQIASCEICFSQMVGATLELFALFAVASWLFGIEFHVIQNGELKSEMA